MPDGVDDSLRRCTRDTLREIDARLDDGYDMHVRMRMGPPNIRAIKRGGSIRSRLRGDTNVVGLNFRSR